MQESNALTEKFTKLNIMQLSKRWMIKEVILPKS